MKLFPAHLPMPDSSPPPSDKHARLRQAGLLNLHPERVLDPRFDQSEFFDPRDILQVRYEMVRRVRFDKLTLAKAAERFGVSLPTCFRAVKAFARDGLQGLVPDRRGPRGPHKITPAILDFVDNYRAEHGRTSSARLVQLIEQQFGIGLHPRGLEKALARREKKRAERSR